MDLRAPLHELTAAARAVRAAERGGLITYSPKVFIPLTKLCRDVCHYCTFARPPRRGERAYMTIDEVLAVARAGEAAGCREALFTLGDKPELRYRAAREELAALGYDSTLDYLAAAAAAVLEETSLLPHLNPGLLTGDRVGTLRRVSASMGLMLETTSDRLAQRGGPHFGSPDKLPEARLETLRLAGEARVPFTTGILIGIGETREERVEALRAIAAAGPHVQEVIVQNFRAKPGTRMADAPEPTLDDLLWTIAVGRLLLPPEIAVQAPPNLSEDFGALLDAGIDDWGGVSPVTIDHVNPEAPWPEVEALREACASRGLELAPRLTVYPRFVDSEWIDPHVLPHVLRVSDSLGLAREDRWATGESGEVPFIVRRDPLPLGAGGELGEDELARLFRSRGEERGRVMSAADALRREVNGDIVSYVVTRNVQYTNVCYFRCGFCAFSKGKLAANLRGKPYLVPHEEIVRRAVEAWQRGATEICLQGGIHPAFTGDYYASVVRAIKDAAPDLHVHAFSALEIWQGAATLGVPLRSYLERLHGEGLSSLPGTAAEVLDDEVRAVICPDKISTAQWLEVPRTAHAVGLRSNNTIMFGHVDGPLNWARHLLAVRGLQQETGGFTEFVPLPFVHMEAPLYLKGRARPGPTFGELLLMHAVGRLALHPWIENVQVSWVKAGPQGVVEALRAGANDLGGTLMNESISRAAGAGWGQEMPPERMEPLTRAGGRVPGQRPPLYGAPRGEQAARSFGGAALAEPSNPHVNEARLERPRRLVRPAVA